MAYGDFQDQLLRRTTSDKLLGIKAFNIAKNPKYDGYHSGLALMGKDFFEKRTSCSGIKNENMSDQQLVEESHKAIIKNFKKRKVQ